MENQLVVFELANERYGVNITAVESIIKLQTITAVPQAPQFVKGVTNLRGVVLPVINLRQRFDLPQVETTKDTRIVVVEMDGGTVGMIVDAVAEVLRVPDEAIEPPSPLVVTVDSTFIAGIAKLDEQLVIILDLDKVLTAQEQVDLQAVPVT
ncbi:MAG TPA: chemotaxis protein CheW [Anaerolineae bacterium]|nr:chemotaxis protein CheW [Anaerolineae bacterium]MCB0223573.1 chemotaxis protein CheW [Anaerolineae bacterium]HRV90543.1 chemotaxis protein CheW [Anaerolineae bacterium]